MNHNSPASLTADPLHKRLFVLAIPMILSNISTPIIGLVDTAIVAHLPQVHFLAGVALGSLILTQLLWICGFIRMSATGLSAQAKGQGNDSEAQQVLFYSSGLALVLGLLFLLLQQPLLALGLYLGGVEGDVAASAMAYFQVRVWSLPIGLLNLALVGWLVGRQSTQQILWVQLLANITNALLDILFVYGLDWGIEGVALASVIAETLALVLYLRFIQRQGYWFMPRQWQWRMQKVWYLLQLNNDMLLRNLALQLCLAFVTYQGARLGEMVVASNAILMQFFVFIALALDGLAYAAEALVGEAKGQNNVQRLRRITVISLLWSSVIALGYTLVFWGGGEAIVNLLTDLPELKQQVMGYFHFIILLPLVAHWCFIFDGIFIGLMAVKDMRNTMAVSTFLVFFPLWWLLQEQGNEALWWSFLAFLAARGALLGLRCYQQFKNLAAVS